MGSTLTLQLPALSGKTQATLDVSSRSLSLNSYSIQAFGSQIDGTASVTLSAPYSYRCAINQARLMPELFEYLRQYLPERARNLPFAPGQVEGRGTLSGDQNGLNWADSQGAAKATGFLARAEGLASSVTLSLRASLTSDTVNMEQMTIYSMPNELSLSGTLARFPHEKEKGLKFQIDWNGSAESADLLPLLAAQKITMANGWEGAGKIRGNGTGAGFLNPNWARRFRDNGTPSDKSAEWMVGTPRISGLARFDFSFLDNAILPAPIENLDGSITLTNTNIKCEQLKAEMLGSTVGLTLNLNGYPYFWSKTSRGSAHVAGSLELSRAGKVAGATMKKRALFDHLRPEGALGVDLQIEGPLWEPKGLSVTGSVSATSVSCLLDSSFASGELRQAHAKVRLLPDRIIFDQLAGKMRSMDLSSTGTIAADNYDFGLIVSGPLKDCQASFPRLLSNHWTVDGRVNGNLHLRARQKPKISLPKRDNVTTQSFLTTLVSEAQAVGLENLLSRPKLDERFDWDVSGVAHADDVTMTHFFLPAPLTHITGNFVIQHDTLRIVGEANVQWGQARGWGSGSLQWLPNGKGKSILYGRFPSMVLEEWFTNWGPKDRKPEEPANWDLKSPEEFNAGLVSPEDLKFILDVSIVADRATFKRYEVGKSSTHFVFTHRGVYDDSLRFDKINIRAYDGTANGTVDLLFGDRAQWRTDIHVRNILCEKLLEAARHKPSTVTGRLTGNLVELRGYAGNTKTFTGNGSFSLRNSRFLQDPIFAALGKVLNWTEVSDVSFSNMEGKFGVKNGFLYVMGWKLFGTLLQLKADGRIGLDGAVDLYLIYRFLGPFDKVIGRIPVLNAVPKIVDQFGQVLLKIHVGGTAIAPNVTIVPLLADELRFFKFSPPRGK